MITSSAAAAARAIESLCFPPPPRVGGLDLDTLLRLPGGGDGADKADGDPGRVLGRWGAPAGATPERTEADTACW